jgi:hypothetical protein
MKTNWSKKIDEKLKAPEKRGLAAEHLLEMVSQAMDEFSLCRDINFSTPGIIAESKNTNMSLSYSGIPEIPLTELGWNKLETATGEEIAGAQRALLENYLKNIVSEGPLSQKISSLEEFYSGGLSFIDADSTHETISRALSYLVFYKTLTRIIANFNAASAGFTFEAFLATLLGGSQIPANTGTIADFKTKDGIPISLKLYNETTVLVGGSFTDLVHDLVSPKFNHPGGAAMRYVVCAKSLSGTTGEQEGSIKFYEFDFTLDNIADILAGATRAHTAANIILPIIKDNNGNWKLFPDIASIEIPEKLTDPEINEKMKEIANNREFWKSKGFLEFQIDNILASGIVSFEEPESLQTTNTGAFTLDAKTNFPKIVPLLTDIETGEVPGGKKAVRAVIHALRSVVSDIRAIRTDAENVAVNAIAAAEHEGIFPAVPHGRKKDKKEVANILEMANASRNWYNEQDAETKKKALKYSMGYLKTMQFELNRDEATNSSSHVSPEYLGEIRVGSAHLENMLNNIREVLDENIFSIFSALKLLTENLNDYFSNGLKDDHKALSAIEAAEHIEIKTSEVSQIAPSKSIKPGPGGSKAQPGGRLQLENKKVDN